jgi:type II secretory pathway pseudopilin PulG
MLRRRRMNGRQSVATGEAGVTLIEAAIVIGTVALLAAIMAPSAGVYIDQARQAKAREDVKTISDAINAFIDDNAEHQFLINGSNGALDGEPPTRLDTNRVNLLVSDGDIPTLATAISGETLWTQTVNGTTVDTLSNHLAENAPGEVANSRYRNPTDMTVPFPGFNNTDFARSESSGLNAPYAWRGAYLRSPVDPDPWGNRYAVNVAFLDPSPTAILGGITAGFGTGDYPRLDVFVLSAGPDEVIDTRIGQDGAVAGDDDFIDLVSSHAK